MNSHRIWGLALGASLTVNAFCIAALLTGYLSAKPPHWQAHAPLPAQARALFEDIAPHNQPGLRQSIRHIRAQRQDVRAALTADPFDIEALNQAFINLREAEKQAAVRAHQRITEVASKLSPEERQQLAKIIAHRGRMRMRLPRHALTTEDNESAKPSALQ